jgi:hypothetical protein
MRSGQSIRVMRCFVILAVAVLAAGCAGESPSKDGTGKDAGPAQGNNAPATTAPDKDVSNTQAPKHAVGETFVVNGLTWTVVATEKLAEVGAISSDEQPKKPVNGTYLVVKLDFQGVEGTLGGFDTAALKVRDAGGKLYNYDWESGAADNYTIKHLDWNQLSFAMLGDETVQHVFAIYDVPAANGPFTLEWVGAKGGKLVTLSTVDLGE